MGADYQGSDWKQKINEINWFCEWYLDMFSKSFDSCFTHVLTLGKPWYEHQYDNENYQEVIKCCGDLKPLIFYSLNVTNFGSITFTHYVHFVPGGFAECVWCNDQSSYGCAQSGNQVVLRMG